MDSNKQKAVLALRDCAIFLKEDLLRTFEMLPYFVEATYKKGYYTIIAKKRLENKALDTKKIVIYQKRIRISSEEPLSLEKLASETLVEGRKLNEIYGVFHPAYLDCLEPVKYDDSLPVSSPEELFQREHSNYRINKPYVEKVLLSFSKIIGFKGNEQSTEIELGHVIGSDKKISMHLALESPKEIWLKSTPFSYEENKIIKVMSDREFEELSEEEEKYFEGKKISINIYKGSLSDHFITPCIYKESAGREFYIGEKKASKREVKKYIAKDTIENICGKSFADSLNPEEEIIIEEEAEKNNFQIKKESHLVLNINEIKTVLNRYLEKGEKIKI